MNDSFQERKDEERKRPEPHDHKHHKPSGAGTLYVPRPYNDQPNENNRKTSNTEIVRRLGFRPEACIHLRKQRLVTSGGIIPQRCSDEGKQSDSMKYAGYKDRIGANSHG